MLTNRSVPPNVRFIIDDIHEDWDFAEPFDYVHSRMMNFSIPDWPGYVKKIYEYILQGIYHSQALTVPGIWRPVAGSKSKKSM